MSVLILHDPNTQSALAELDLSGVLHAASVLRVDITHLLPGEGLTHPVNWDTLINGVQASQESAQSRLTQRDLQRSTPIVKNVQKSLVGALPTPGQQIVSSGTDDEGRAVFVVQSEEQVIEDPVPAEQLQQEQDAMRELENLMSFLHMGQASNAVLEHVGYDAA